MKDESEKVSMYEKELFYFLFCKPAKSAFLKKKGQSENPVDMLNSHCQFA